MANEIKTINDIFLCDVTARADIAKIVENYASKIYVDDKISNLSLNINLDSYATKTYVKQLINNSEAKINTSLNNYATKTYVDQEISKVQNNNGETSEDLLNYVSKLELEEANYISYYDLYLQDKNGDYIIDEDGNYIVKRYASYNELKLLQEEVNALKQEIKNLKNN